MSEAHRPPPRSSLRRSPHWADRALFLAITVVLLIGGVPSFFAWQNGLREWADPFIDGAGLWQGQWELFAPQPDMLNSRVRVRVVFEDGAVKEWWTPNWVEKDPWYKFRFFRLMEFSDAIRQNSNSGAWRSFAHERGRRARRAAGGKKAIERVELWRHWGMIPKPKEPIRPISDPVPISRSYMYFVLDGKDVDGDMP